MEVLTAESAGFCFGVRRAVDLVREQCEKKDGPVYTYGPIIHNEQVVQDLEKEGVQVVNDLDSLSNLPTGVLIIRSHGVSRAEQERIEASSMRMLDATCPFVKKIHRIVEKAGVDGHDVLIAGDPDHPEVRGIIGWTKGPSQVLRGPDEAATVELQKDRSYVLVAQTTFQPRKFEDIVAILQEKEYDISVMNTVCSATEERQTEAQKIARQVDAMIVIGGRHSSNTRKLVEICRSSCRNTTFIETLSDLDLKPFQSFSRVGITAGASTPNRIIEEVTQHVRTKL